MTTPYRRHRGLSPVGPNPEMPSLLILELELEPEVVTWLDACTQREYLQAMRFGELLAVRGRALTAPYAKPLRGDVHELRPMPWRITYWFPDETRAVLLTVFRKKRNDEDTPQVERAIRARKTCEADHAGIRDLPLFDREER